MFDYHWRRTCLEIYYVVCAFSHWSSLKKCNIKICMTSSISTNFNIILILLSIYVRSESFRHKSLMATSEYSKKCHTWTQHPRKRVTGHRFVEIGNCVRATAMLLVFRMGGWKEEAPMGYMRRAKIWTPWFSTSMVHEQIKNIKIRFWHTLHTGDDLRTYYSTLYSESDKLTVTWWIKLCAQKLFAHWNETETKQFQNGFETVFVSVSFRCADTGQSNAQRHLSTESIQMRHHGLTSRHV